MGRGDFTFVVVVKDPNGNLSAHGPYRTRERAEHEAARLAKRTGSASISVALCEPGPITLMNYTWSVTP